VIRIPAGAPATIEDLGSKNGTWVAGARLGAGPTPLTDGDTVRLGRTELVFLHSREIRSTQTVEED
jgi:pSer/pThr/pTyr-binding forkhead associated (FHA) protein